jgi:hypothetical protein
MEHHQRPHIHAIRVQDGVDEEWCKNSFEERIAEHFLNLVKDTNPLSQEAEQPPHHKPKDIHSQEHQIKLLKIKEKSLESCEKNDA